MVKGRWEQLFLMRRRLWPMKQNATVNGTETLWLLKQKEIEGCNRKLWLMAHKDMAILQKLCRNETKRFSK